jgi:hypothetical protein
MFTLYSAAFASIQITGTVTAKRAGSVKIEFKPHKTAGPQSGDLVDFKTMIQGIEVNAGQGEVTESETNFAWGKIIKGRPNLKMTAFIHATGEPGPVEYILDIEALRDKGKVLIPSTKLSMELQSGLKFKTYDNSSYNTNLSGDTLLSVSLEAQGWGATPLDKHHRAHIDVRFKNNEDETSKVIWQEREVKGASAFCIASRAQRWEDYGMVRNYFDFYASCKAKNFTGQSPESEPYFSFSLTDRYKWEGGNDSDHAETVFLNMLRSLAIEVQQ